MKNLVSLFIAGITFVPSAFASEEAIASPPLESATPTEELAYDLQLPESLPPLLAKAKVELAPSCQPTAKRRPVRIFLFF